jgi:glycosyltransferase involved in cell wall biosynthesis
MASPLAREEAVAGVVLSVVVCTHNPRVDYLARTLQSLRRQSLAPDSWELLVIDNASTSPVGAGLVEWHPLGRVVREGELGLTHARMRGISEAFAPLLVFVDDDNVLSPTYLADAMRIADELPFLGAWGGQVVGEFESPAPKWLRPYLSFIAVKDCREPIWSNEPFHEAAAPIGAGMCIRRGVARRYSELVATDPIRVLLGRRGGQLSGCEDTDMALTAIDMGLGLGRFPQLVLTHIIPAGRMTEAYILKLAEESQISIFLLREIRRLPYPPYFSGSLLRRCATWMRLWTLPRMDRRIRQALVRGQRRGKRMAAELLAARSADRAAAARP